MRSWRTIAIAGLMVLGVAATARADIIIVEGTTSAGDVENILFNEPGLTTTGTTVEGALNNTGEIFTFTGTETLTTPAIGQARIQATDGAFDYLLIDAQDPGHYYEKFVANVNLSADAQVRITATDQLGNTETLTFSGGGSGENWFYVIVQFGSGQLIDTVLIETLSGEFIQDVRQVRIGGVTSSQEVIPEPASLLLFGTGLAGLGGAMRRRMKARKTT